MKCFACDKIVPDDTAVCPFCETVLDTSLIEAAPPPEGEAEEAPAPRPRRTASKPAARVMKRPAGKPPVKKRPAPKRADTPPPQKKQDWREQLSQEDWGDQKPVSKFEVERTMDPDAALKGATSFIFRLALSDKLALFGTSVLLMSTFFPWKETVADGEVLGITSSGLVVTVLASAAIAGLLIRTRSTDPKLNPLMPWALQLGAIGFAAVWSLLYVVLSWDSTPARSPIGNYEVWVSKPSFGLILAILACVVAVVGTIFGLKEVGRR